MSLCVCDCDSTRFTVSVSLFFAFSASHTSRSLAFKTSKRFFPLFRFRACWFRFNMNDALLTASFLASQAIVVIVSVYTEELCARIFLRLLISSFVYVESARDSGVRCVTSHICIYAFIVSRTRMSLWPLSKCFRFFFFFVVHCLRFSVEQWIRFQFFYVFQLHCLRSTISKFHVAQISFSFAFLAFCINVFECVCVWVDFRSTFFNAFRKRQTTISDDKRSSKRRRKRNDIMKLIASFSFVASMTSLSWKCIRGRSPRFMFGFLFTASIVYFLCSSLLFSLRFRIQLKDICRLCSSSSFEAVRPGINRSE